MWQLESPREWDEWTPVNENVMVFAVWVLRDVIAVSIVVCVVGAARKVAWAAPLLVVLLILAAFAVVFQRGPPSFV
jgi:hypothetical protein